jgi:hypothetical protein
VYKEFIKLDDTPMVCLKSVLRAILTEKGPFPGGGMGKTFSLLDSNNDIIAQIGLFDDGNPHVGIWDPTKVVNKRAKHGRRVFPYLAKMKPTLKYKTQKEIQGLLSGPRRQNILKLVQLQNALHLLWCLIIRRGMYSGQPLEIC